MRSITFMFWGSTVIHNKNERCIRLWINVDKIWVQRDWFEGSNYKSTFNVIDYLSSNFHQFLTIIQIKGILIYVSRNISTSMKYLETNHLSYSIRLTFSISPRFKLKYTKKNIFSLWSILKSKECVGYSIWKT